MLVINKNKKQSNSEDRKEQKTILASVNNAKTELIRFNETKIIVEKAVDKLLITRESVSKEVKQQKEELVRTQKQAEKEADKNILLVKENDRLEATIKENKVKIEKGNEKIETINNEINIDLPKKKASKEKEVTKISKKLSSLKDEIKVVKERFDGKEIMSKLLDISLEVKEEAVKELDLIIDNKKTLLNGVNERLATKVNQINEKDSDILLRNKELLTAEKKIAEKEEAFVKEEKAFKELQDKTLGLLMKEAKINRVLPEMKKLAEKIGINLDNL